ncbi:MAG: hypothetical protein GX285_06270 [Clostridiales bacterium]|nr:hypothetical protein [Clostridiales bacterium]
MKEISEIFDISKQRVSQIELLALDVLKHPERHEDLLRNISLIHDLYYLDNLSDFIEDHTIISAERLAERRLLRQQVDEVLKTLSNREERVIRLRFGIDDGYDRTLEEVGNIFQVTRERIRQLEDKALSKLRHPTRAAMLQQIKDNLHVMYTPY